MRADEGLPSCVVEVVLHEEVQQVCRVAPDRTQLGVTALQYLVTEPGTQVGPAVEERTRELGGRGRRWVRGGAGSEEH